MIAVDSSVSGQAKISATEAVPTELVGYVTKAVIMPGSTINVAVGILDNQGMFLSGEIITIKHTASATSIQVTSMTDLVSGSLLIPAGTPVGLQELTIESGSLSLIINLWVINTINEGSSPASLTSNDLIEVSPDILFNGTVFYESTGTGFVSLGGVEFLVVSLVKDSISMVLSVQLLDFGFFPQGANLDYQVLIPGWLLATENYTITFEVINSPLYQNTLSEKMISVIEPIWDYTIAFSSNDLNFNRLKFGESISDYINLSLTSVSLSNLEMEVLLVNNQESIIIHQQSAVLQTDLSIPLEIPFSTKLGENQLIMNFYRLKNLVQVLKYNIFVYDLIDARITLNPPDINPGQEIELEIVTFEEDTLLPLPASITIHDWNTQQVLLSEITPNSGQIIQSIVIPENSSTGIQNWIVDIQPISNSSYYQGQSLIFEQTIFSNANIELIDSPLQIIRGQNITLKAAVKSNGQLVSDGQLVLKNSTGTILKTFDASQPAEITLLVDNEVPIGRNEYLWEYSGSINYHETSKIESIIVLSRPQFDMIDLNTTQVIPNEWVNLTGYLFDENALPVPLVSIELWKLTETGEALFMEENTDSEGKFVFEFQMTSEDKIGIHSFELRFPGDAEHYYLSTGDNYRIEISRNLELTLVIDTNELGYLFGNEYTTLHLNGRIWGQYLIEYVTVESEEWFTLTEISLNETGQGSMRVFLPNYFGPIKFRAQDTLSEENVTLETKLYVNPSYHIETPDPLMSDAEFVINIYSSVDYRVYIDGLPLSPPDLILTGQTFWNYTFTAPGTHTIGLLFENEYVVENFVEKDIYVAQGLNLEIFMEEEILEGSQTTIDLKLTSSQNIPLSDVEITLVQNNGYGLISNPENNKDIDIYSGITQSDGTLSFSVKITGSSTSLRFKIREKLLLNIIDTEFSFPAKVIRKLDIDLSHEEKLGKVGFPIELNFQFYYSYTPQQFTGVIPFIVEIKNRGTTIKEFSLTSNNQGEVNLQLPLDLQADSYILVIMIDDPNFISITETRTLRIETSDPLQTIQSTNILTTIGATLGFLIVLTYFVRKYTRN